jgi:hypothetical protein
MSWLHGRIAEIMSKGDQIAASRQNAIAAREIVAANEGHLWDMLAEDLLAKTKEFVVEFSQAEFTRLAAERRANIVTITTKIFPMLRFQIVYHAGVGVDGEISETYSALAEARERKLNTIRLTVDPQMEPCFTDGDRYLHPAMVSEELMEQVARFYENAARKPRPLGY